MYEDVLERIKELYQVHLDRNRIYVRIHEEFMDADFALAYLRCQGKIKYTDMRDGRVFIQPIVK